MQREMPRDRTDPWRGTKGAHWYFGMDSRMRLHPPRKDWPGGWPNLVYQVRKEIREPAAVLAKAATTSGNLPLDKKAVSSNHVFLHKGSRQNEYSLHQFKHVGPSRPRRPGAGTADRRDGRGCAGRRSSQELF